MSLQVRRLVAGGRGGEFRFISGGVFHLVKINKICEGGDVKQKVAGAQKKGRPHGVAPTYRTSILAKANRAEEGVFVILRGFLS